MLARFEKRREELAAAVQNAQQLKAQATAEINRLQGIVNQCNDQLILLEGQRRTNDEDIAWAMESAKTAEPEAEGILSEAEQGVLANIAPQKGKAKRGKRGAPNEPLSQCAKEAIKAISDKIKKAKSASTANATADAK
jgi:hypothetical protein